MFTRILFIRVTINNLVQSISEMWFPVSRVPRFDTRTIHLINLIQIMEVIISKVIFSGETSRSRWRNNKETNLFQAKAFGLRHK